MEIGSVRKKYLNEVSGTLNGGEKIDIVEVRE